MRVLLDYRPALKSPTGVGQYFHHIARGVIAAQPAGDSLALFSSSWRDRLPADAVPGAESIDRSVPVRVLNLLWNRLEWPPIETLTGRTFDVVQSSNPLLIPSRSAAQVVHVADLDFLDHPERTQAEIKRDYPALARAHAARADHVLVNSPHTADQIKSRLDVPAGKITIATPGVPDWSRNDREDPAGTILFLGTLEPRKNLGVLLDAYERLVARRPSTPPLVLAGGIPESAAPIVERTERPPLAGRVTLTGYVAGDGRLDLYRRAVIFVLPSFMEGFGMPAVEAMRCGVPVVVANRGALPEVVGDAGRQFDPADPEALAQTIDDLLSHPDERRRLSDAGWTRSLEYTWARAAERARQAWAAAIEHRRRRG